jgi:hypothetical protein
VLRAIGRGTVRIVSSRPLLYTDGADEAADRPAHVRSASALAWWGGELLVVQDDANFFALVGASGDARAIELPRGPGGLRCFDDLRGNKSEKLDLEACIVLDDGRLVAFGSGSTPARERLVVMAPDGEPEVVDASPLYAALRSAFSDGELNIEGTARTLDAIRFFQRGNGRMWGGGRAANGTVDLDAEAFVAWLAGGELASLRRRELYDLGAADGVPYSFTDAIASGDRVTFLAVAEDSPDAIADGRVCGVVLGAIDGDRVETARVLSPEGAPSCLKLEGLARIDDRSFWAVADADDPTAPSLLCKLVIDAP